MVNIRAKGQRAEREVAGLFNTVVIEVRKELGLPQLADIDLPFQRNQNQSAVGGSDLTNPYYLEIEVKHQEQLSVNTWWKQCVESARRTGGMPVLIYKVSRKGWFVVSEAKVPVCSHIPNAHEMVTMRAEFKLDDFLQWFKYHCTLHHTLSNV